MRARLVPLAVASAMLLSGCGAISVQTRSGDGGPMKVGVGLPEPTTTAPAGPETPPGTTMETLTFEGCPFDVEVPVPEAWNMPAAAYGDTYLISAPGPAYPPDAQITVRCTVEDYDDAQGVAESTQRYRSQEENYTVVNERRGSHEGSAFWVYFAETTGDEILNIGGPADEYGIVMGVSKSGRTYEFEANFKTVETDETLSETFAASVEATTVDGRTFDLPD